MHWSHWDPRLWIYHLIRTPWGQHGSTKFNCCQTYQSLWQIYYYVNAVILRCKNCDEANWKIYIKKICRASTCRMTMIRRALDSPMSKDLPRYLQRCRRPHRKFSRAAWTKSSSSKHDVLSEYSSLTLSFIFQNLNFFHFSWHIIWLVCRAVTIFFFLTDAKI